MKWEDFRRSDNIDDRRSETMCSTRMALRTIGQTLSDVGELPSNKDGFLTKVGNTIGGIELGIVNAVSNCVEEKKQEKLQERRTSPLPFGTKPPTPAGQ